MFDYTNPENVNIDFNNDAILDKAINSVVKHYNSRKGREELHLVLVACAHHAVKHKGCDKLTHLWNLLPETAPKRMVKDWLDAFTSFRWLADKKAGKKFLGRDEEGAKSYTFDLKGQDMPFYLFKKEPEEKAYVFKEKLDALFKVAFSKIKNGKVTPTEADFIRYMNDAATNYKPNVIVAKPKPKPKAKAKAKADVPEIVEAQPLALAA